MTTAGAAMILNRTKTAQTAAADFLLKEKPRLLILWMCPSVWGQAIVGAMWSSATFGRLLRRSPIRYSVRSIADVCNGLLAALEGRQGSR